MLSKRLNAHMYVYVLLCVSSCMHVSGWDDKSSKMAHFVFKCNKEGYLSLDGMRSSPQRSGNK